MVGALEALGVGVEADWAAGRAVVHGCGGRFPAQGAELFLGNAGTAMRCKQPLLTLLRGVDPLDGSTITSCAFEAAGPSCEAYRNASSCPPALHLAGLRHQAPDSPGIDVCTALLMLTHTCSCAAGHCARRWRRRGVAISCWSNSLERVPNVDRHSCSCMA